MYSVSLLIRDEARITYRLLPSEFLSSQSKPSMSNILLFLIKFRVFYGVIYLFFDNINGAPRFTAEHRVGHWVTEQSTDPNIIFSEKHAEAAAHALSEPGTTPTRFFCCSCMTAAIRTKNHLTKSSKLKA